MELITRKSECKHFLTDEVLIKSPKEITKKHIQSITPKYCIIVKPFHSSFLPYKQIIFKGVTFSDDFSIELIRNNEAVVIASSQTNEAAAITQVFHNNDQAVFQLMQ